MIMGFSSSLSLLSNTNLYTNPKLCHNSTKPIFNNTQMKKPPTSKTPSFNLSNSSNPQKKTTHLPKENNLNRIVVEKALSFVVGSVLFIGCLTISRKPAMASVASSPTSDIVEESEETHDEEKMEFLCEKLLEREPRNVDALKVVLYGRMRRGRSEEAVRFAERLAELEPREVEWKLLTALCYELMGQLSQARKLFKEILKERPLLLRALHGLALVMHKNREGMSVFVMLNKALEIARKKKKVSEERSIKILIAQMHVVRGELEEGLTQFQVLVDEDHRDFRPYLCLGIIYSLLDKKEEAAEQFEIYRSLVPEEFPQRSFLDDAMMAAKTKPREQLREDFQNEYSNTAK